MYTSHVLRDTTTKLALHSRLHPVHLSNALSILPSIAPLLPSSNDFDTSDVGPSFLFQTHIRDGRHSSAVCFPSPTAAS